MNDQEELLYTYMINAGLSPEAAAGILGNMYVETGPKQRYQYEAKQVGGPGRGLFQMEGNMLKSYNGWLKSEKRTDSPYAQIDFMKETIYGSKQGIIGQGNAQKIRESFDSGNATVAATAFANLWERPNVNRNPKYNERTTAAENIDARFAQSDDAFLRQLTQQAEKDTGVYKTPVNMEPTIAQKDDEMFLNKLLRSLWD